MFFFGWAYIVLGVAGYILTGSSHKTALIPAIFGLIFVITGWLAGKTRKRLCVLFSICVALVAFLATFRSFEKLSSLLNGTAARPAAVISQATNAVISSIYIIIAVLNLPPPWKDIGKD